VAFSVGKHHFRITWHLSNARRLWSSGRADSDAPETLPTIVCPDCEEPMSPKGAVPVTRELDDVSYVCPKCGAETTRTMKRT
jgi:RNase P subunit RPR2